VSSTCSGNLFGCSPDLWLQIFSLKGRIQSFVEIFYEYTWKLYILIIIWVLRNSASHVTIEKILDDLVLQWWLLDFKCSYDAAWNYSATIYRNWNSSSFNSLLKLVFSRGVHGPVQSGFNPEIQPNQKIAFLVIITRTKLRIGSNRTGFVRFGLVF